MTGVKVWGESLIEDNTMLQAERLSRALPVVGHVALMPDAHVGSGATVGSVIQTYRSLIPAAVGVDIGCGMRAEKTNLFASDLSSEMLKQFSAGLRQRIPAGVGGARMTGSAHGLWYSFVSAVATPERLLRDDALYRRAKLQFGTLGDGNHFIELEKGEDDHVWIVLHSGSRGIGNVLAGESIRTAKAECASDGYVLEDPDLAWLVEGTESFATYKEHLLWAQRYAYAQRAAMASDARVALAVATRRTVIVESTFDCHHNYSENTHSGLWLTRKGAIDASAGKLGIIPGSMGDSVYIVRGKGDADSYNSAPHGAGRRLARGAARRTLDVGAFRNTMRGVVWQDRDAESLIDEAPEAYKDIAAVIDAASPLVEVQERLTQLVNYKGTRRLPR